jgi:hypothetical protein
MTTLLKRRLRMTGTPVQPGRLESACRQLEKLDAVRRCRARGDVIELAYDPLAVDLQHLLEILGNYGLQPHRGFLQRCRRAWYQYQDEAVCENAGAPPPACCNKPPRKHG